MSYRKPVTRRAAGFALLLLLAAGTAGAQAPGSAPAEAAAKGAGSNEGMLRIPGGEFDMGNDDYTDASPVHRVRLAPFFLDRCEVTNAQYLAFCESTQHRLPEFWGQAQFRSGPDWPDHPVVGVNWFDATAYARWRGARLPTEAEWEWAARGGLLGKGYSHGDELDPALYAPTGYVGEAAPSAVGGFPPNGYGLHDMTSNVAEWVADWYDFDFYRVGNSEDPTGPGHGKFKVVRGGGWHTGPGCSHVYDRNGLKPNWQDFNVGFRCARYAGASAAAEFGRVLEADGLAAAEAAWWRVAETDPGLWYFDERELNDLGYAQLNAGQTAAAVYLLEKVTVRFPRSSNAWDNLADAYHRAGDDERARACCKTALALNPRLKTSQDLLELLGGK